MRTDDRVGLCILSYCQDLLKAGMTYEVFKVLYIILLPNSAKCRDGRWQSKVRGEGFDLLGSRNWDNVPTYRLDGFSLGYFRDSVTIMTGLIF